MHDLVHYVVEKRLNFEKGFWGMLASGYRFIELSCKIYQTEDLRFIEKLVGPVTIFGNGHFEEGTLKEIIDPLEFPIPPDFIGDIKREIFELHEKWKILNFNESLVLYWK